MSSFLPLFHFDTHLVLNHEEEHEEDHTSDDTEEVSSSSLEEGKALFEELAQESHHSHEDERTPIIGLNQ